MQHARLTALHRSYAKVLAGTRESFSVVLATEGDHPRAADIVNTASAKGVAFSTPDALIAAQALNRRATLLTTDADFGRLAKLAGLRLAAHGSRGKGCAKSWGGRPRRGLGPQFR